MKAVLDTNVLAPGLVNFFSQSPSGRLTKAWRDGQFELVSSEYILTELESTFMKPHFRRGRTPQQITGLLSAIRIGATMTTITVQVQGVATQPADDLVIATAVSAQADYLVTEDIKLQRVGTYQGVRIVSPREFLQVLERGSE